MTKKKKVKSYEEKSYTAVTGITETNQERKYENRKDTKEGLPAGSAVPPGY